jgi:hypothetical protein
MADSPRIEELKRRVRSDPASIAFAALAEEYRRAGRYEEAIAICRTGLGRHPSYISAHVTLGRALMETGQYDQASEELEHVLRVAPENLAAIRGLAEIHHRLGQTTEGSDLSAAAIAEMAAALAPVPQPVVPIALPKPLATPETIALSVKAAPAEGLAPREPVEPPEHSAVAEPFTPPEQMVAPEEIPAAAGITASVKIGASEDLPPAQDIAPRPVHEPPPRVPIPVVTAPSPRTDPALEGLEAFLHAIVRARQSAVGIHLS